MRITGKLTTVAAKIMPNTHLNKTDDDYFSSLFFITPSSLDLLPKWASKYAISGQWDCQGLPQKHHRLVVYFFNDYFCVKVSSRQNVCRGKEHVFAPWLTHISAHSSLFNPCYPTLIFSDMRVQLLSSLEVPLICSQDTLTPLGEGMAGTRKENWGEKAEWTPSPGFHPDL